MEELAPNGIREQDVRVLIGITAALEGRLAIDELSDRFVEKAPPAICQGRIA